MAFTYKIDGLIKIDLVDIQSTNIKDILYVADGRLTKANGDIDYVGILIISFRNNSVYKYSNVKLVDVVSLISTDSIGTGFNRYIKSVYGGERIHS